ncbi:MAG: septum formation initiator family protein [Clostridia bacterium]|nr:septum formation initiator family protein [Clostridia bacterium]
MIIRAISIQPDINQNKQEIAELESEIEAAKERQAEVDHMRENADSDEYIEKVARDTLGMVKSDEIVFIDVSEE